MAINPLSPGPAWTPNHIQPNQLIVSSHANGVSNLNFVNLVKPGPNHSGNYKQPVVAGKEYS